MPRTSALLEELLAYQGLWSVELDIPAAHSVYGSLHDAAKEAALRHAIQNYTHFFM